MSLRQAARGGTFGPDTQSSDRGAMAADWRRGLHPEAIEAVESALSPDEPVRLVIYGASHQAMVATDRRVLVFKKGFLAGASFGSELTSWAYRHLLGVQVHTGLMTGAVVLQAPGQTGATTSNWKGGDTEPYKAPNAIPLDRPFDGARRRVAELGRILDAAHRASAAAVPDRAGSIADELRKLADLRGDGVLSEQEFASLNAKLLT
jgi:hypothetical protein